MQLARSILATNPRLFGRGPVRELEPSPKPEWRMSDDLRLSAATFVAGFLFVSILIG